MTLAPSRMTESFVKQRKINLVTSIPPSAMHLFNLCCSPALELSASIFKQTQLRRLEEYCVRQNNILVLSV